MSGFFNKLVTAIRGGAHEAGEALIDSQEIRIFEQEVRDSRIEIRKAESQFTKIMADETIYKEDLDKLNSEYDDYGSKALAADEAGNQDLAIKIATKMGEIQSQISDKTEVFEQTKANVIKLKQIIQVNNKKVEKAERSISTIKAQIAINKATESISSVSTGATSKLVGMEETLDKLKRKNNHRAKELEASQALDDEKTGKSLDQEIENAGLSSKQSASDILASLKRKKTG
jgi:phage shock protein A